MRCWCRVDVVGDCYENKVVAVRDFPMMKRRDDGTKVSWAVAVAAVVVVYAGNEGLYWKW